MKTKLMENYNNKRKELLNCLVAINELEEVEKVLREEATDLYNELLPLLDEGDEIHGVPAVGTPINIKGKIVSSGYVDGIFTIIFDGE